MPAHHFPCSHISLYILILTNFYRSENSFGRTR